MHGKTQVFPLPESDITHTRLTHSLEVSCVARSLGSIIEDRLCNPAIPAQALASVAAAAALAHDLGNPPFGHSGEAAIGQFFEDPAAKRYLSSLTAMQQADLTRFEGNALGFRLLARSKPREREWPGGMQLTFATLGAFSKYPRPSLPEGRKGFASEKKFGFFQSETHLFEEVAAVLGLPSKELGGWARHPLAFLLEAADDICYRIIDLEDGFRLNLVPFERAEELLTAAADMSPSPIAWDTYAGIVDPNHRIGYLRAKGINNLTFQVADAFLERVEEILAGVFEQALLDLTPGHNAIEAIKTATQKLIYPHRPVIEIETAGYRVLGGLLEDFVAAAWEHPRSRRAEKVLSMISREYLAPDGASDYDAIMGIVEFVASMTDDFAISCYRVLRGIELPRT